MVRPATFERIRAAILSSLAEAQGPLHAEYFAHAAGTDYDRAREVRKALEAEGVIHTYKDMNTRNHPLVTVLVKEPSVSDRADERTVSTVAISDALAETARKVHEFVHNAMDGHPCCYDPKTASVVVADLLGPITEAVQRVIDNHPTNQKEG